MRGLTWICTTNYYAGAPSSGFPARCREGVSVCGRRADLSWAAALSARRVGMPAPPAPAGQYLAGGRRETAVAAQ